MKHLLFLLLLTPILSWAICPDWQPDEANKQLNGLQQELNRHDDLYYNKHAPVLTDSEYDALKNQLQSLKKCFPDIKVEARSVEPDGKVQHRAFMGSLQKASSREEIADFIKLSQGKGVLVQPKIDGVAVELVYVDSKLIAASTRGDGNKGQDLLKVINLIPAIPKKLPTTYPEVVLHGELFVRLDSVDSTAPYSSARHYVAGHISRSESDVLALSNLDFFPWHWANTPFTEENESINVLYSYGFDAPTMYTDLAKTVEDAEKSMKQYLRRADKEPFLMDGVVLKLNSYKQRETLGWSNKTPNWALAWKFPADHTATKVKGVDFRVGRTGHITPVVQLEAVQIKGETIEQVSMGSLRNFKKHDIAIGDQVSIQLKGAATPVFNKVLHRPFSRKKVDVPDSKRYNEFTCLSMSPGCQEQLTARLKWFTNRMDLPVITAPKIQELIEQKAIVSLSDIFLLSPYLLSKAGWNEEQSRQLIAALKISHAVPFDRQVRALGIPMVGESRSRKLGGHFKHWDALLAASDQSIADVALMRVEQVKVARDYLQQAEIQELIKHLMRPSK